MFFRGFAPPLSSFKKRMKPVDSPKILLIDNYDSYTFNLFQYFATATGSPPTVIENNQYSWEQLEKLLPSFDAVVISPGPGNPNVEEDFGVCMNLLLHCSIPILGICLGHEGLAAAYGGEIKKAPRPMHGRLSKIRHQSTDIFNGIPQGFEAVRYHSLIVDDISNDLEVIAETMDSERLIMALRHKKKPIWSVQFHPEVFYFNLVYLHCIWV